MPHVSYPLPTEYDTLLSTALARIQAELPGWTPTENRILEITLEELVRIVQVLMRLAVAVPDEIYKAFGEKTVGIPPIDAAYATVPTTWTLTDTEGHSIPAGTVAAYKITADDLVAYRTTAEHVVPAGSSATAAGAVIMQAVTAGKRGNAAVVGPLTLVDSLAFVASVEATAAASGGVDAEDSQTYLARLADNFTVLAPRPILPPDFAIIARNTPGVARAVGVDGHNPFGNMLTVNQASVETDTAGWVAHTNVTIARSTAQAADGVASLSMTATAAGDMAASTSRGTVGVAVIPGETYTGLVSMRAAATARTTSARAAWFDSAGALLSTFAGTGVTDGTGAWTQAAVTAVAPANAATMAVEPYVVGAAAGEVHYADKASIARGFSLTWYLGNTVSGNERTVGVYAVDSDGEPLAASVRTDLENDLDEQREVNFDVFVAAPVYTAVDVTTTVRALPGYVAADVETAVNTALTDYLDPANWGVGDHPATWRLDTVVRRFELVSLVDAVTGVDYVESLTVQGAAADLTLPGVAPLPRPGSLVTTVTAP